MTDRTPADDARLPITDHFFYPSKRGDSCDFTNWESDPWLVCDHPRSAHYSGMAAEAEKDALLKEARTVLGVYADMLFELQEDDTSAFGQCMVLIDRIDAALATPTATRLPDADASPPRGVGIRDKWWTT